MKRWLRDAWEDWLRFALSGVLVIVGILAVIASLGYTMASWDCSNTGKAAQVETRFDFPSGCYVKIRDRWVPADKWIWNTGN